MLESTDLMACLQHILAQHATSSTVVFCSTKEDFLERLQAPTTRPAQPLTDALPRTTQQHEDADHKNAEALSLPNDVKPWDVPTLRLLASSRFVKLAFCPDITHLRAFLSTVGHRHMQHDEKNRSEDTNARSTSLLAVANPIQLHRPTSAFSAQGLNRTFSLAVEAAHFSKSRLIFFECESKDEGRTADANDLNENGRTAAAEPSLSPWDEELSILNVSTKSFGAGERGWVGRTIKIRAVAARWCTFEAL